MFLNIINYLKEDFLAVHCRESTNGALSETSCYGPMSRAQSTNEQSTNG